MIKVYIVIDRSCGNEVDLVFATESLAKEYCSRFKDSEYYDMCYEEHEVLIEDN